MGNKHSQSVTHNQRFTIRLVPRIIPNGPDSPSVTTAIRQDLYQYLNCQIFLYQIQNDLNNYFLSEKDGILQVVLESVHYYDNWNILIVKGLIRVMKPTRLNDDLSAMAVKNALYRAIPAASKGHKYPVRQYGNAFGPGANMLRIRFHKIQTSVRLITQEKSQEWKEVKR